MTNNVKTPRYLEPSEIELWELAKRATPGPWTVTPPPWDDTGTTITTGRGDPHGEYIVAVTDSPCIPYEFEEREQMWDDATFISKANPLTIAALLETLEKTRALLVPFARLDRTTVGDADRGIDACAGCRARANYYDEEISHLPDCPVIAARALLAGFSGDASKEEE